MTGSTGLVDVLTTWSDEQWLDLLLSDAPSIAGHSLPTMPPLAVQQRSNATADASENLRVGFRVYRLVKEYLRRLGRPLAPGSRVLDFGCGWGRVARFFLKDVRPDCLFGIDPATTAIEALRAGMPYGTFRVSETWPPSGFDAETFDLVYAVSVFSHLPEDLHLAWVEELARILRPGGILIATTLPRSFVDGARILRERGVFDQPWKRAAADSFPDPGAALAAYDAGGYLFAPQPLPEFGMTLIPRAYVERAWSRHLHVEDFVDDGEVFVQAVIVASRRGEPARDSESATDVSPARPDMDLDRSDRE